MSPARALFVLGTPRSGTTLIGTLCGRATGVVDLGEYRAFVLAHDLGRTLFRRTPAPFADEYLQSVALHARSFAEGLAARNGAQWYVDHTPINLLVAERLACELPDALFVLMVRHHAGVIQSLARSYRDGYDWAGEDVAARAQLYSRFYEQATHLPPQRTIAVSYDALCTMPAETLVSLREALEARGFPGRNWNLNVLAQSHANGSAGRQTIGKLRDGEVVLGPMSSFDAASWTENDEARSRPHLVNAREVLARCFPATLADCDRVYHATGSRCVETDPAQLPPRRIPGVA
jgi:hypothetical protein